jgi:hypothetical protein
MIYGTLYKDLIAFRYVRSTGHLEGEGGANQRRNSEK